MPDQFDKTIKSISDDYAYVERGNIERAKEVMRKRVDRKKSSIERDSGKSQDEHYQSYSVLSKPDEDLWDTLIEAVRLFNERQDMKRSPFTIRIWAQNEGIRVQLIHEETGNMIKQTKILRFTEITSADLNDIINDLVSERGVVIDVSR